ncbi:MAG: hypothetical protein KF817_03000 [Phycisphaeraceae bacterium]|nr:hypothetical protein [Phycisphaeraceae bacterium]
MARTEAGRALTVPDGWLALVGLAFLEDGEHLAGRVAAMRRSLSAAAAAHRR